MNTQSYCLNLHEKYAPNWSVWECARELFANAKDASPDDVQISSPDANTLQIYTPTVPNLAQLFIIGCGSKTAEDEKIGQFGEGLKLTALTATRADKSSLTVRLPKQTVTFDIREHFGERVLFADVEESDNDEGCLCVLTMPGAGYALNGKIIDGETSRTLPKAPEAEPQIFCKGIWITNHAHKNALFSYNLNDLALNRDRSHAEPYSIKQAVGRVLLNTMSDDLALKLVSEPRSFEADDCLYSVAWSCPDTVKEMLADALRRHRGDNVAILTDLANGSELRRLGYEAAFLGDGLTLTLTGHIPTDIELLSKRTSLQEVTHRPEWSSVLRECRVLAEIVDMYGIEFKIFADRKGGIVGKADSANNTVWLNERLMLKDNRFELIRTVVHELAHIQSEAPDESHSFEAALDLMAGKLALRVLGGAK